MVCSLFQNGFIKACERGFKKVIEIFIGPVADGVLTFNVNCKDVVRPYCTSAFMSYENSAFYAFT